MQARVIQKTSSWKRIRLLRNLVATTQQIVVAVSVTYLMWCVYYALRKRVSLETLEADRLECHTSVSSAFAARNVKTGPNTDLVATIITIVGYYVVNTLLDSVIQLVWCTIGHSNLALIFLSTVIPCLMFLALYKWLRSPSSRLTFLNWVDRRKESGLVWLHRASEHICVGTQLPAHIGLLVASFTMLPPASEHCALREEVLEGLIVKLRAQITQKDADIKARARDWASIRRHIDELCTIRAWPHFRETCVAFCVTLVVAVAALRNVLY